MIKRSPIRATPEILALIDHMAEDPEFSDWFSRPRRTVEEALATLDRDGLVQLAGLAEKLMARPRILK